MKIIQKYDSLLSSDVLEDILQENYGFYQMNCRLLVHSISDIYILENELSKYIFKVYQDKHIKLEQIKGEVELLNILHQRKAKTSYPIADKKGKQIQIFNTDEGLYYGVLYSYAQGKVCFDMSDQQLATVGKEMAAIHNITSGLKLKHQREELNFNTLLLEPIRKIKPAFRELEDEYNYLRETTTMVMNKLEQLDLSSFSYGYCHYDLLPVNFHFEDNGNITFFDFGNAGKGYLINDLISVYAHYFLQIMLGKIGQNEANYAFLVLIRNYCKIRPLFDTELKGFPYFGFAFWLYYIAFDYEHFDDRSGTDYLRQQTGWIKNWVDWYISPLI